MSTDAKLPPKLNFKKPGPAPVAVAAPAPAPAVVAAVPSPTPVAGPAASPVAAVPVAAAQAKPLIAAPKLTPKAPGPIAGPTPMRAAPAAPNPVKPATSGPSPVPTAAAMKKPTPVGVKPVATIKPPVPVAAAKPVMATATPMHAKPAADDDDAAIPDGVSSREAARPDAKRMTAKISLDAVLSAQDSDENGPKTIRLKRPGETGVTPVPGTKPKLEPSVGEGMEAEAPKGADDVAPKRMIRVKRPSSAGDAGSTSSSSAADVRLEDLTANDSPHWAFVLSAVAAVIVAALNLYIVLAGLQGWPWIG